MNVYIAFGLGLGAAAFTHPGWIGALMFTVAAFCLWASNRCAKESVVWFKDAIAELDT